MFFTDKNIFEIFELRIQVLVLLWKQNKKHEKCECTAQKSYKVLVSKWKNYAQA